MATPFDSERERHRRRLMLMRMQGETNRQELRMIVYGSVAIGLAVIALFSLMGS